MLASRTSVRGFSLFSCHCVATNTTSQITPLCSSLPWSMKRSRASFRRSCTLVGHYSCCRVLDTTYFFYSSSIGVCLTTPMSVPVFRHQIQRAAQRKQTSASKEFRHPKKPTTSSGSKRAQKSTLSPILSLAPGTHGTANVQDPHKLRT